MFDGAEMQSAAEAEEGDGRREPGEFTDGPFKSDRQFDAEEQERETDQGAEDERICDDILHQLEQFDLPAPVVFEQDDRDGVVGRDDDRHQHGRERAALIAKHALCHRDTKENEVGAVQRLDDD